MSICNKSGVYQIKNTINGKVYIGSSTNISSRWRVHKSRLKNGVHHSEHLQSSWNMYGQKAFEFSVLEICPSEKIRERESELIKQAESHLPSKGYNLIADPMYPVISQEGIEKMRKTKLGKKLSEEHREKIRQGNIGKIVSPETREKLRQAFLGKKRDPKIAKKVSEIHLAKYKAAPKFTDDEIRSIFIRYKNKERVVDIMKDYSQGPASTFYCLKNGRIKHCADSVAKIRKELQI